MSQDCKACIHERRAEIDQAIRQGLPLRSIAEGFGLGLATVWRHKRHLEQPGTEAEQQAEQQAEQGGTQREKASGTRWNKAEQPAGQDNTGQAVLIGVIDTLRSELERQGETLKQMLQDYAKEREERARERERADIIIMGLREDVKNLNNKIFLLTEGKQDPGEPPEKQDQEKPKQDTPGPPEPEYKFTFADRLWLLGQDIKRVLNKRIF